MTMSNETRLSTFRLVTTATDQKVVWGKGSASCHHRPPRNLGLCVLDDKGISKDGFQLNLAN